MKILVTGRAGAGKTTVAQELQRRGFNAFDSDEMPGLARWIDVATGQPTDVEDYTLVDKTKTEWRWDEAVLAGFLAAHHNVFVCGSADNDLALHRHFDKVFVLNVSPETQAHRLRTRTNSDYGKHPQMIAKILAEQAALIENAQAIGATLVNANAPIEQVVGYLVSQPE